jgi:phosphopantothenoylcysteine decarboxylase/phosphopantothenate--cysteine ligase
MTILAGKNIILGVSGGVAAYKAAALASQLTRAGAHVETILTEAAQEFIRPLTFSAVTHRAVHTEPFAPWTGDATGHVGLAERADLLVVAPATAATIARLALGLSEDLIGLVGLSTPAPILIAPAMEDRMFHHPATQEHLATLRRRGVSVVGPESGRLASGATGDGRLAALETIIGASRWLLGRGGPLAGSSIVVTAGGTRENLDPVRYLGNRSSGQMGYALAEAAIDAGADVTLISGPVSLTAPFGVSLVVVTSALEMRDAVNRSSADADALIMAAAVADFRPATTSTKKIKKEAAASSLDLHLVRTPDILASINRPGLAKIGFAAETDDLLRNAAKKLQEKGLSMIVANDAASTIGASDSEATLIYPSGEQVALPRLAKEELAAEIVRRVADILANELPPTP